GIGGDFEPIDLPPGRAYLVAQPPQQGPTASAFSSPDLTRDSPYVKMSVFADWQRFNAPDNGLFTNGLFGRNDLEPVVFATYPRVAQAAKWLCQQGLSARMSGSGACFFVEFVTIDEAVMCQRQIIGKIPRRESADAVVQKTWACAGLI